MFARWNAERIWGQDPAELVADAVQPEFLRVEQDHLRADPVYKCSTRSISGRVLSSPLMRMTGISRSITSSVPWKKLARQAGSGAHPLHCFNYTHSVAGCPVFQIAGADQVGKGLVAVLFGVGSFASAASASL